jgi:hypothetical protein
MSGSTSSGPGLNFEIDVMGQERSLALQKKLDQGQTHSLDRDRLSIQP